MPNLKVTFSLFIFLLTLFPQTVFAQDEDSPFAPERMRQHEGVQKCQDDLDSEECQELISSALENIKPMLIERLEQSYARLEKAVERAKTHQNISDEASAELDQLLVDYRTLLDEIIAELETAESAEDLRGLAQKAQTGEFQARIRNIVRAMRTVNAVNLQRVLENMYALAEKVSSHIDAASTKGHDVTVAQEYYDSAMTKLAQVEGLLGDDASTVVADTETREEIKTLLRGAHSDLKSAVAELKALYRTSAWEENGSTN